MERDFKNEQNYLLAKKRVEKIKGFYKHLTSYILVNILISAIIISGLMNGGYSFSEALSNFGVYSLWGFWGIGMFFHWIRVFGQNKFFSKEWEEKKLQEYMNNDKF